MIGPVLPAQPVRPGIPWYKTLQARMVIIFFLIILLAMEVAGNYLSYSLRRYYVEQQRAWLAGLAENVAGYAGEPLSAAPDNPDRFKQLDNLLLTHSGQGVELSIVDLEGNIVSSSRTSLVGKPLPAQEVRQALAGLPAPGTIRLDPDTRRNKIFLATPVAGREGRVVGAVYVAGSLERIDATVAGTRAALLTTTLLALAVSVLLSFLLARTITGPVQELTARAAEMAGGGFDRLIEVRSHDEVGRLAGMFNHLTVRLRETLDEISAERRKAEAILTHMTDGILALDRSGRTMLVNPAAARMLGIPPEGALGSTLAEVTPALPVVEAVTRALAGPAGAEGAPIVFPIGDLVLKADLAPLRDPTDRVAGVVVVLHDVTGQEKLEAMRREFVANVSHELRTPLTTIKSYVETILEGAADAPEVAGRFMRVVAAETDRMARLVNDLLTLTQLDSGRIRLERRPLAVGDLLNEVCDKFAERCARKGVRLACRTAPGLPPVVGDRDRLEQVLANLLVNAVDFTPAGGTIEARAEAVPEGVMVAVHDTGVGIPPADLPRIFERFYRVDKARSREFGGTGLGLSIVKELVEAHGGRVGIESAPGLGTEVWFTLPAGGDERA